MGRMVYLFVCIAQASVSGDQDDHDNHDDDDHDDDGDDGGENNVKKHYYEGGHAKAAND